MRLSSLFLLGLALAGVAALAPLVPAGDASDPAPAAATPRLQILAPYGGQTRERVIEISGVAEGLGTERLTLVLNGVPLPLPVSSQRFQTRQVLSPGWNSLRVEGGEGDRRRVDEVAVFAQVPRKDLRITMTWDTAGTDVDLWVTGPDGEKIYYSQKQGQAGGTLDTDVTSGHGPETYTQARAAKGTYRVQANYYSGQVPTRVRIHVIRDEGTPEETREEFRGVLISAKDVLEVASFHID